MEWFAGSQPSNTSTQYRKEVAREKKKRYIFKNTETRRFTRLMRMCADKLGTESALEFFGRLGRETGIKEFNALIRVCLDKARDCEDIDSAVEHIFRAYRLFELMKDRGFQIEEDSYGPFLLYLVDVELLEEFEMFSAFFKDANPRSYSRIAYYEMLLLIRAQDEESIQELCRSVEDCNEEAHYGIAGNYPKSYKIFYLSIHVNETVLFHLAQLVKFVSLAYHFPNSTLLNSLFYRKLYARLC
jgi:hypothetical protein